MEIHNTTEDIVFDKIGVVFDEIQNEGNPGGFCLCQQCRLDTACYVLNRTEPHYVISNRGAARVGQVSIEWQQRNADIVALVYEGIKRVSHNQRPNFDHARRDAAAPAAGNTPVYNIPTIIGRLFDGSNFSPMADTRIELLRNGELVAMKDGNWQNPCNLVVNTEGTFTFWPNSVPAKAPDSRKIFEYSLKIEAPGFEPLTHFFKIPVISEFQTAASFSMNRTFKLPDLYMFPPENEDEGLQYNP